MRNELKLAIVCGTLESGGAERVISILSTPFANYFREVIIITWREAPHFYEIDTRVSIISLPTLAKSNNNFDKIKAFRNYIKQSNPNLVLSFLTIFNIFTLISLIGINIPIIVAERNDPRFIKGGPMMKYLRNLIYHLSDGILCQTQSIKKYFKGSLNQKAHIIYNPIILTDDTIGKAIDTAKRKKIVSIGRLHPQKNHKLLIDAFKEFHENHKDYILTIYGKGPLKDTLQEYIDKIGLSDSIILAGEQSNVRELILDAEVFIMTSLFEGMPNALIEAMCIGLPCISTKVSGAIDLIKHNENGLLVNYNAKEISNAISSISENNEFAKSLAIKASSLYESLNLKSISIQWIDYLQSKVK